MNNKNKMLRLFECYQIPNYPQYELHYSENEQKVYSKKKGDYLKNNLNNCGYYHVRLYNDNGNKDWRLNRLVWYVFNGEIPENMQVNHINEDKTDNRIDNLNLMTPSQNTNYGTRNQKVAEKMLNRQDKSKVVIGINKTTLEIIEFPSSREAERVNKKINHSAIIKCCQHKTYKTVNNYYWFYKEEFNELLTKFNGNIKNIIKYKINRYG